MKSIFVAMLLIVSSTVFAESRLPTMKEAKSIINLLESNNSIQQLTNYFKTGVITPFFSFSNFQVISTPNESRISGILMARLKIDSPLGKESENLEMLKVLLDLGLDPNIPQTDPVNVSENVHLLTLAALECSVPAVDLLLSKGARIATDNHLWLQTSYKGYNYDAGSKQDLDCSSLTTKFLEPVEKLSLKLSYLLLSGTFNSLSNEFDKGFMLFDGYNQEIKDKLTEKFGIKPSIRPNSDFRGDEWVANFQERFAQPSPLNDQGGPDFHKNWWGKYTDEEKEWACFISTFDELYPQLKKLGYTDEEIMEKKIVAEVRGGARFGRFAVEIFTPYCDSIRN